MRKEKEGKGKDRGGKEKKGKEKEGEELAHLCIGFALRATVHCNPTSKHQHEQPHTHTYNMQMHIYILHANFICISNMLTFVF